MLGEIGVPENNLVPYFPVKYMSPLHGILETMFFESRLFNAMMPRSPYIALISTYFEGILNKWLYSTVAVFCQRGGVEGG